MRTATRCVTVQDIHDIDNIRTPLPGLFRSAVWGNLAPETVHELHRNNITLIIDLREPGECAEPVFPGQRDWDPASGIKRIHLPLYRRSFGSNPVPVLSDINSVYLDLLLESGDAIAEAVTTISRHRQSDGGAVLIHCGSGKDRTGLVSAILMQLAGRPTGHILADYTASEAGLSPERRAQIMAGLQAQNLPQHPRWEAIKTLYLQAPPAALISALQILANMGGAQNYLEQHRCREQDLVFLRRLWTQQEVAP